MQRLYSMFPDGWPGRGLLLLRLVASWLAIHEGVSAGFIPPSQAVVVLQVIWFVSACLVLIGLATPFAAVALSLCGLWMALSRFIQWPLAIALGGVALALAMLGPGSMSIDAVLFGRKHIDYDS